MRDYRALGWVAFWVIGWQQKLEIRLTKFNFTNTNQGRGDVIDGYKRNCVELVEPVQRVNEDGGR